MGKNIGGKILKLVFSIVLTLLIGFVGSLVTNQSFDTWYNTINKPSFNPPNWLFVPVWTILFIMIGLSLFFVWEKGFGGKRNVLLFVYFFQLALNMLWSYSFFGLTNPLLAFLVIIVLWIIILINIVLFYKVSKVAGILLIPYILWVSFASILNLFIVILN